MLFEKIAIPPDDILGNIFLALEKISKDVKKGLLRRSFIREKEKGDVTYEFDIYIEKKFVDAIRDIGLEIPVLGEETTYNGEGDEFILIDPIDGSTNAQKNLPFFAIVLAYVKGKKFLDIQNAVVWDIPHERIYFASKGRGAFITDVTGTKKIDVTLLRKEAMVESLIDITPASPLESIKKIQKYGKLRHLGSLGLSICYVCEGALDVAADISGRARMVDVAAPIFILKEARGFYLLEPEEPVKPDTNVVYIVTWRKDIYESVKSEVWPLRKKL